MADTYRVGWTGGLYKQTDIGVAYSFNYQTKEWIKTQTAYDIFWDGDGEDTYPSTEYEVNKLIKLSNNRPYLPSEHAIYVPMQGEFYVQIGKKLFLLSCYNRAFYTDDGYGNRKLIPNMYIDYTLGCFGNLTPGYDDSEAIYFIRDGGYVRFKKGYGFLSRNDEDFFWKGMNHIPNSEKKNDEYCLEFERMAYNWHLIGKDASPTLWMNALSDMLSHRTQVIVPIETPDLFSEKELQNIVQNLSIQSHRIYTDESHTKYYIPIYTSEKEQKKAPVSSTIRYCLYDLINAIPNWKNCRGLMINPYGEKVVVQGEALEKIRSFEPSSKIEIYHGSLLDVHVDAIVNAANKNLLAGGGIDEAIHKAAGHKLQEECFALNGCKPGHCKMTRAYDITWDDYIIHAVGPRKHDEGAPAMLWNCYYESLQLAAQNDCHSIAFPCISTGRYGYPLKPAAEQAIHAIIRWLQEHSDYVMNVILCCYRDEEYLTYKELPYDVAIADTQKQKFFGKEKVYRESVDGTKRFPFCMVSIVFPHKPFYCYFPGAESLAVGDKVLVPFGANNEEKVGMVVSVGECYARSFPCPIEKIKTVIRKLKA